MDSPRRGLISLESMSPPSSTPSRSSTFPALARGPGACGAVLVFDGSAPAACAAARDLLSRNDDTLLVGLGAAVARVADVVAGTSWSGSPGAGPALFVQVAAPALPERDAQVQAVEAIAARHGLQARDRVLCERLREGREAFGFLDGKVPTAEELAAALTPAGDAVLLWMHWAQDVAGFAALPSAEQERVLGVDRTGRRLHDAPPSAHVRRMERASIVRRGMPISEHPGLAFVAVASSPAILESALRALDGDALTGWAMVKSAATFVVLRDASRVDAVAQPKTWEGPMTYGKDPMLVTYPAAVSMLEYILKAKELGAFSGTIGEMTLNPYLEPVLQALHEVLAGGQVELKVTQRGSPEAVARLNEMIAKAMADSNEINKRAGYYVTIAA